MTASSSLPAMGNRLGNRQLAALALCLVLLLDVTTTTLVLASKKGKGGGGGHGKGGGGGHGKGGGSNKGAAKKHGGPQKGGAHGTAGAKPGGAKPTPTPNAVGAAPAAGGTVPAPGTVGANPNPIPNAGPGAYLTPMPNAGGAYPIPIPDAGGANPIPIPDAGGAVPAAGGTVPVPGTAGAKPGGVNPTPTPTPTPNAGGAAHTTGGTVPAPGVGGPITYHGGPLMTGNINLSILFYGEFKSEQREVIRTFLRSLENTENDHVAAVHRWWDIVESYQLFASPTPGKGTPPKLRIKVGTQQSDDKYSIGKVITYEFIKRLLKKADSGKPNTITVIFTGSQVTVHSLCRGRCYEHGLVENRPYIVVGNPEILCSGSCAWPFQRLDYGTPNQVPVKPPNGDMGIDAMVVHFASALASAVTNPFNTGFFKPGPKSDPIEAVTACENIFGSGAVPGQTGKVEVDPATGASYNAIGDNGMKFMLPAVWDPRTSSCWTSM
ncbi:hypothetical protein ACFX10_002341 [Malus domestica]